jgi:hypothetical protein
MVSEKGAHVSIEKKLTQYEVALKMTCLEPVNSFNSDASIAGPSNPKVSSGGDSPLKKVPLKTPDPHELDARTRDAAICTGWGCMVEAIHNPNSASTCHGFRADDVRMLSLMSSAVTFVNQDTILRPQIFWFIVDMEDDSISWIARRGLIHPLLPIFSYSSAKCRVCR